MKLKHYFIISLFTLVSSLQVVRGQACGNNQQGGPSDPNGGSGGNNTSDGDETEPENNTSDGDPVNVYTANDHRETKDVEIWGGVGEHKLNFRRFTNSRFVGTGQPFGAGSNVRHNYKWDMADYGVDSKTGAARVQITYPNSSQNTFTQVSPTQWLSTPGISDVLNQNGNRFTLISIKLPLVRSIIIR
jgi:hypothetical protein